MEAQRVYARIDLDALDGNVTALQSQLPPTVKSAFVVKSDAYGHGAKAIAAALADRADYFAVADVNEGAELRQSGITTPILLLGGAAAEESETVLRYDLTPAVFRWETAKTLSDTAKSMKKTAKIHLAVDTGMARIGFSADEKGAKEAARIGALPHLAVTGIFSHFAEADRINSSFSAGQAGAFGGFLSFLRGYGVALPLCHMENSAAAISHDRHYDMVRLGIALYGVYPSEEIESAFQKATVLSPILSLSARISEVKTLARGCSIGYGRAFVTERETRVATIDAGYGDGYPFSLSGRGEVLIGGRRCPILGRVCMDRMMADVTGTEARAGDMATLLGRDGGEEITAAALAKEAGTIPYALLCGISRRVPRIYYRHKRAIRREAFVSLEA